MSPNGAPKTVPNDRIRTVALADVDRRVELSKPFLILKYGHDSARTLLDALRVVRRERNAQRGALTDEEQDLLRAMLVMAASGLDSMTKQLIRDALPVFCRKNPTVLTRFQTFVSRQLKCVVARNFGEVQAIYSDAAKALFFLREFGPHQSVAHIRKEYVVDEAHVNSIENAWSLFKRGLIGMYHHVSAKYLQEYLDEFAFRYSHTKEKGKLMDLVLASCKA